MVKVTMVAPNIIESSCLKEASSLPMGDTVCPFSTLISGS